MDQKLEDWLVTDENDAAALATSLGYRPCAGCGTWLPVKTMTEGSMDPETGELLHWCAICVAQVNHLLEVKA